MGGVWEEPNVEDCICTEENKTTSGITLTWPLTLAGEPLLPLVLTLMGMLPGTVLWEEYGKNLMLMTVFVSKKPRLHRLLS